MNDHQPTMKNTYSFGDYLVWSLFAAIPVLTALYAISRASLAWTVVYLIVFAVCLGGIEYRFFCTHCPHYGSGGGKTRCLFLWGVPAWFKPREGPLRFYEKILAGLGFAVVILFPVYWLLPHILLLLVYLIAWVLIGVFLKRYECGRCINRNCPLHPAPSNSKGGQA
jgi:hypothetical protein